MKKRVGRAHGGRASSGIVRTLGGTMAVRGLTLRGKALAAIAGTSVLLAAGLAMPLRAQYLASFEELETVLARGHVERVRGALDDELAELGTLAFDYAVWDDAVRFLETRDPAFIAVNWDASTFRNHRLAAAAMLLPDGTVAWSATFDGALLVDGAPHVLAAATAQGLLPHVPDERHAFVSVDGSPWAMSAHAVVGSRGTGEPSGTLLVARRLDRAEFERLSDRLRLRVRIDPAPPRCATTEFCLARIDDRSLRLGTTLTAPDTSPVATLRLDLPRDLYARGLDGAHLLLLSVLAAVLLFGAVVMGLVERVVLRRVTRLGADVREISGRKDHAGRVAPAGDDELGELSDNVNGMLASLQTLTEDVEKARSMLRDAFGRYVSEDVARAVLADPSGLALGGELREVTILFSDLRGYSTISEHLPPQDVVAILNEYFGAMSEVIEAEHGVVIEFLGDAILAVFGAPAPLPDHAAHAARAALAMRDRTAALNRAWDEAGRSNAWRTRGIESFQARIGVHTGRVVAGNLGSKQRVKYAVVGDAVNAAARVEGLNNGLGTDLLVTDAVYERLPDELRKRFRTAGEHPVKGRSQAVRVWTPA